MIIIQLPNIEIAEHVGIYRNNGLSLKINFRICDASSGTENLRFFAINDLNPISPSIPEDLPKLLGFVVEVDDDPFDALCGQFVNCDLNNAHLPEREQGLWCMTGEALHAGAIAGGKYHCCFQREGILSRVHDFLRYK